jgi:DNA repair photolyase
MIREIEAKVLLNHVKQPDTWFGLKYNMNLYRGCQHQCIYCDSRSLCYQIEAFDSDVLIKANAVDLLRDELSRKRVKGTIGTGSMNDPYMPLEKKVNLMGRALQVIAQFRFPVHIITKSDLVLRDVELLHKINQVYAAVSFTITTADDDLAKKLEPGAPPPSLRFAAMRELAAQGIHTGVVMMPILPFIEDSRENITQIITQAHANGASYIIPSLGVTLRDRQRAYFYEKLTTLFPGVRKKYVKTFGNQYYCVANDYNNLSAQFQNLCNELRIATHIPAYSSQQAKQLSLF